MVHTRGVRLHAATAGSADHPLILLLHGACGAWFDWRDVLLPLADCGYHVAAVDMRGYGLSDHPAGRFDYDLRGAVGDITGVIRSLGHDSATLIGEGSGGAVAWAVASKEPELVSSLISIGAIHPADFRRLRWAQPWFAHPPISGILPPLLWRHGVPSARAYRRNLIASTHPRFHDDYRFEECLSLRLAELSPQRPRPAVKSNIELTWAKVPSDSYRRPIDVPATLIHPGGAAWEAFEDRARRRSRGVFRSVHIPDTVLLPHIEDPGAFLDAIVPALGMRLRRP